MQYSASSLVSFDELKSVEPCNPSRAVFKACLVVLNKELESDE